MFNYLCVNKKDNIMIDCGYKFKNGENYYNIVVDLSKKQYFMMKNASCYASVFSELKKIYGELYHEKRFKAYSNGKSCTPDVKNIPIRFRKYEPV